MSDPSGQGNWISFADLMASSVAIVVVMLVISVASARIQKESTEKVKESAISTALKEIQRQVAVNHLEGMVRVEVAEKTIILEDATFQSASACLEPAASTSLAVWSENLMGLLDRSAEVELFIEGHSDSRPLIRAMNRCGAFDDNYTLSTVRARNARSILVKDWPERLQQRVSLAGFGNSHPLHGMETTDPRNRRVAIRLLATSPQK